MEQITQLVVDIVSGYVEKPEAIETHVTEETDDNGEISVIHIKVDKSDIGVCIGKEGENAKALRKVIGLVGFKKLGRRVFVKIDAPQLPKNHFNKG